MWEWKLKHAFHAFTKLVAFFLNQIQTFQKAIPFKEGANGLIFSLWSLSRSFEVELLPKNEESGPERLHDLSKDL